MPLAISGDLDQCFNVARRSEANRRRKQGTVVTKASTARTAGYLALVTAHSCQPVKASSSPATSINRTLLIQWFSGRR